MTLGGPQHVGHLIAAWQILLNTLHGFDLVLGRGPVGQGALEAHLDDGMGTLEVVGSEILQNQIHHGFDLVQGRGPVDVAVGASLFDLLEVMSHCRIHQRSCLRSHPIQ